MRISSKRLRYALLATALAVGGGGIAAAQVAATYDPAQLPAIKGRVAQIRLAPRGDVDGLILEDGTQVMLPPHLGTQLVFAVKPGDVVTVRGLRAREVPLVQAMQVTNDASSQAVTDAGRAAGGPRGPGRRHGMRGPEMAGTPLEAQGRIKAQLHGRRGDVNGVLLEDGTIVRMPPPEAQRLAGQLAVGQPLFVRGEGMATPLGRVIAARAVGADAQAATPIQRPHMGGPGGHHGRGPDGGPRGPGAPPPPAPAR